MLSPNGKNELMYMTSIKLTCKSIFLLSLVVLFNLTHNQNVWALQVSNDEINRNQANAIPNFTLVPGTVIHHIPASTRNYLGSPSILILPNGDYIASMDVNSWNVERPEDEYTIIFKSEDKGITWEKLSEIDTQHWASLFYYKNAIYIAGTRAKFDDLIIQKSTDGGRTWSEPKGEDSGVIAKGKYHCAPVPVVFHEGRIWRAVEVQIGDKKRSQALVMSASADSDLLRSSSWTLSNYIVFKNEWLDGANGWIEGNIVVTPDRDLVNIIRLQTQKGSKLYGLAAQINIVDEGKKISFDPKNGFIPMPGGTGKKFTIRFDSTSSKYWSLVNWIPPKYKVHLDTLRATKIRNTLALVSSTDLKDWRIEQIVLQHPDFKKHGFQYADWQIEGEDIITVVRTGYEDGLGGPRNYHDANFITFHRIENFRN